MPGLGTLSSDDTVLFEEIRDVMDRHPLLKGKYGIWLAHEHFEVEEGQILAETVDVEGMVMSITPTSIEELPDDSYATLWAFDETGDIQVAQCCSCHPPD